MSKIRTSVLTITPATAKEWLARGGVNRKVKGHVRRIKEDILAGRWVLNGQSITLDRHGRVIDGQHRLLACVQADRAIESVVAMGADPAAFDTIDTGSPRSAGDMISVDQIPNAAIVAAATRIITWYDENYDGDLNGFASGLSATVIHRNAKRYGEAGLFDIVSRVKSKRSLTNIVPAGPLSAVMFIAVRGGYADVAEHFLVALETGADLAIGDAALALRSRLIAAKSRRERIRPQSLFGLILKAWNGYVSGEPVKLVRIAINERAPRAKTAA